jgi:hypothetical protein
VMTSRGSVTFDMVSAPAEALGRLGFMLRGYLLP